MRELTINEVEYVGGGNFGDDFSNLSDEQKALELEIRNGTISMYESLGLAIPSSLLFGDVDGFGGSLSLGAGKSKEGGFWGSLNDFISKVGGKIGKILSGGFSIHITHTTSDGTQHGFCTDKNGNVIRNEDGNPLLACKTDSWSFGF